MLRETAKVEGRVAVAPHSTLTILDQEAQKAERAAAKLTRGKIRDDAPVGPGRGGKHLRDQHRYSVRRTPFGYLAQQMRTTDGWYGRIVENGRQAGFSRGRHYPAARANPYVERAAHEVEPEVVAILEAGGEKAAERIAELV
jgi:hypothetical protein